MTDCGICKHYQGKSKCAKGCSIPNDNCAKYEIDKDFIDKTRTMPEGLKYDTGKNRMGLVLQGFSNALWEVGRVGTFGANKYSPNSWQNLTNGKERYLDALCRHLFKHLQGEKVDEESGLLHLSHLAWNALCLLEFELGSYRDMTVEDLDMLIQHCTNEIIQNEKKVKKESEE